MIKINDIIYILIAKFMYLTQPHTGAHLTVLTRVGTDDTYLWMAARSADIASSSSFVRGQIFPAVSASAKKQAYVVLASNSGTWVTSTRKLSVVLAVEK